MRHHSNNRKKSQQIDKYFKNKHGKFVKNNKKINISKMKRQMLQQELMEYQLDYSPLGNLKYKSICNKFTKKSQKKSENIICSHHMISNNKTTNNKNVFHSMSYKKRLHHLVYGYIKINSINHKSSQYIPLDITKLCYQYIGYDKSLVNTIFPDCNQLPFKMHYFTVKYSKTQTIMENNIILTIYPNDSCISCLKPLTIKFIKYSSKIKEKFDVYICQDLLNNVITKFNEK
eukprot:62840_1